MIRVEGLTKTFTASKETVAAVAGIDFEVGAGEMVTLLGPSGCGKTTTLRCVAGLERADGGRIIIGDRAVVDVGGRRVRAAASAQYRHGVPVLRDLAAHDGARKRRLCARRPAHLQGRSATARHGGARDREARATLADRPAPRLSGGQQQRVAIARAMVGRPQVLLFDEPLSNLDARLRLEMRNELRRIQRQIGISSIYVTHDQAEALAVSDWIMVMKDGRIVERGRPLDIYRYPRHVFTAQFLGTTNLIAGTVESIDEVAGRLKVVTPLGPIIGSDPTRKIAAGAKVRVSIRPEDLYETAGGDAAVRVNVFEGTLTFAIFAGVAVEAEVRCGEMSLACLLNREADLTPGRPATLRARAHACLVLPEE